MNIKKIIIEETRLFVDSFYKEQEELGVFDTPKTEGVGDKYAERQFGIGDTQQLDYLRQTADIKQTPEMGEFVGSVKVVPDNMRGSKEYINVYMNPSNLKNFEPDVRATSDSQGNLYVAQHDGRFTHDVFYDVMRYKNRMDVYNKGLAWHRITNTNKFGLADSSATHLNKKDSDETYPDFLQKLNAVRQKNPALDFIPEYYGDL